MSTVPANPHWQSAPYEESGIGTMSMIATAIADAGHRCKAFTLTVRQSDHPNLFEFVLKETQPVAPIALDTPPASYLDTVKAGEYPHGAGETR